MWRNEKVSAEKVAQCEAKAHQIVETLLDPVTSEAEFLNKLRWINQDHYQSITEERAIQKTCGYPLCEKKLVNIPTKKYHICTKNNKVYDLTSRKNFCSNECYKASSYLKNQLFVSPLWVREHEKEPKFILLKNEIELIGDEISFGIEKINLHEPKLVTKMKKSKLDTKESKLDHRLFIGDVSTNVSTIENNVEQNVRSMSDDSLHSDVKRISLTNSTCEEIFSLDYNNSNPKKYVENNSDNQSVENHLSHQLTPVTVIKSMSNVSASSNETESSKQSKSMNNLPRISRKCTKEPKDHESKTKSSDSSIKDKSITTSLNLVLRVEKYLREWCTVDTFSFIMGAETVKQMMLEKGRIFEIKESAKFDSYLYERYKELFRKLKILELEEEKYTNEVKTFEKPTKPLPDFATLEKQTQEMEIKVRAFFNGDKKVTFNLDRSDDNENDETSMVLPIIHHHSRMAIRRNIVLDKLKTALPDLALMLGIRLIDLNEKIKQLALTCKFAAHNITLRPLEWNLMGLILIKLLSLRNPELQKCFREKANYVNAMLMSYQLESNYLDFLCTWLMDLDLILRNEEKLS